MEELHTIRAVSAKALLKEWPCECVRATNGRLEGSYEEKMKDFSELETWSPKKLRTLRNNINNRLESYKNSGGDPKNLSPSHSLAGLEYEDLINLQKRVKKLLKDNS